MKDCPEKGYTASMQTCRNSKLLHGGEPHSCIYWGLREAEEDVWQGAPKTTGGRVFTCSHTTRLPCAALNSTREWQKPQSPSVGLICSTTAGEMCLPYMIHNQQIPTRNHRVCGLCLSFGILKIRNHNVFETGSLSVFRLGEVTSFSGQPMSYNNLTSG